MLRIWTVLAALLFALSACMHTGAETQMAPDGKPLPRAFRILPTDTAKIQFRVLDSVNAFRRAKGLNEVELSAALTAAAATHSRDMSLQNRPWHFGSDGSSPIDRVARTGYSGQMLGENISETFEDDIETLAAWMEDPHAKAAILNPNSKFMGISWHQEVSGKIWWTQIFGS